MGTDPDNIRLGPEQRRRIAELAEQTGRPWKRLLTDALDREAELVRLGAELEAGSEQAKRGELLDSDDVFQRLLTRARELDAA